MQPFQKKKFSNLPRNQWSHPYSETNTTLLPNMHTPCRLIQKCRPHGRHRSLLIPNWPQQEQSLVIWGKTLYLLSSVKKTESEMQCSYRQGEEIVLMNTEIVAGDGVNGGGRWCWKKRRSGKGKCRCSLSFTSLWKWLMKRFSHTPEFSQSN